MAGPLVETGPSSLKNLRARKQNFKIAGLRVAAVRVYMFQRKKEGCGIVAARYRCRLYRSQSLRRSIPSSNMPSPFLLSPHSLRGGLLRSYAYAVVHA